MFKNTGREGVAGVVLLYSLEAVAVASEGAVPAFFEEVLSLCLGCISVVSKYRSQIHLELYAHLMKVLVACLGQVAVALRVGEERMVSGLLEIAEGVVQARRGVPGRCLDKDRVAFHREEVAGLETCVEEIVKHVLRRKVEADATGVRPLELFETLTEAVSGVRSVLHYVRGAPYVGQSRLFLECQDCKGIFKGRDTIIHTVQDVGMTVGGPIEDAGRHERLFFLEYVEDSHIRFLHSLRSVAIDEVA